MSLNNAVKLQIANFIFGLMPLTRMYPLRARMLHWAGLHCAISARIVSSARIISKNVSIGKETFIGHQVLVVGDADSKIVIGNNVDIAPRVVIVSGTHEIDMVSERSAGRGYGKEIIIEDGVWIGANCTITPGTKIGYKSVIGAGSLVVGSIPPYSIAYGIPARVIKKWDRKKNEYLDIAGKAND